MAPLLRDLPGNVLDIAHHGLTEMVNDAIDHSEGERVQVVVDADGERLAMMVADDGVGIFNKITRALSLPDEYAFAKTIVPVRLARIGDENLVSRSQAKLLLQRVERFRSVALDFDGVERVGQAFADEIFRVFALAHPDVELVAVHATTEVQHMIRRAEVLRDETAHLPPDA